MHPISLHWRDRLDSICEYAGLGFSFGSLETLEGVPILPFKFNSIAATMIVDQSRSKYMATKAQGFSRA